MRLSGADWGPPFFTPAKPEGGLIGMHVALREQPFLGEDEWLRRCQAGDSAAWRLLFDAHFDRVYRLALRMGVPNRDVPDLCQEVFLRVHRSLHGFRGECRLSTWIFRIACNEIARAGRASQLRRMLPGLLGARGETGLSAAPTSPDEQAARSEAVRELSTLLGHMKPKLRVVFILFELEELSLEEIAVIVQTGPETVKSRLRHARLAFDKLQRQRRLVSLAGGQR